MFVIKIKLHNGDLHEAYRDTLEAAERYERLLKRSGLSLPGLWLNPSNIQEIIINEQRDDPPELKADTKVVTKRTRGKRKPAASNSDLAE